MEKLRVGVIGVGYLGKFHAEKYARMDDVDLVGIVDIEKKKLIKKDLMKEKLGRSPDYLDMLIMRMIFEIKNTKIKSKRH